MKECDQVQQLIEEGLAAARCFAKDATKYITELESDRRRIEWLALNNARVWLQDGWYDIHDSGGTCIVFMVEDWRDAIDKAMQEGE